MSKIIKYMSKISRNVIFSKSKNPTSKINQDLGGGYWGGIGVYMGGIGGGKFINQLLNGLLNGLFEKIWQGLCNSVSLQQFVPTHKHMRRWSSLPSGPFQSSSGGLSIFSLMQIFPSGRTSSQHLPYFN